MPAIVKIPDLPSASTANPADVFILQQAGVTKQVSESVLGLANTPIVISGTSGTLTLDRNNGYYQKVSITGNVTLAVPINGVEGNELKLFITAGGAYTLSFNASISIPSDSSLTLPKTLTSGKVYIVALHNFGAFWGLQTLIGGY